LSALERSPSDLKSPTHGVIPAQEAVRKSPEALDRHRASFATAASRPPQMRNFLSAIKDLPHPEERPEGASRRTYDARATLAEVVFWISSHARKPESITTGDGGIEPIPSPSASMDPGLRRDDNEMVRRGISPDWDVHEQGDARHSHGRGRRRVAEGADRGSPGAATAPHPTTCYAPSPAATRRAIRLRLPQRGVCSRRSALSAGRGTGDGRLLMGHALRHRDVDSNSDDQQAEQDQPRPNQRPAPSLGLDGLPAAAWRPISSISGSSVCMPV